MVAATTPKTPGAPPAGRGSNLGRGPAPARTGVGSDSPSDHHLGRKVKTRWPDDNTFYEAVITDYDPEKVHSSLSKPRLLWCVDVYSCVCIACA